MMKDSLKVAVDHPDVKILNCSLNTSHKYIRTYYARMYEAKFLSGMIAGALAENDRIAYIADYPIYGMIANINALRWEQVLPIHGQGFILHGPPVKIMTGSGS